MEKSNFILFLLLFVATQSFNQSWEWANGYGSGSFNYIHSIKENTTGEILISGIIQDTMIFGNDTLNTNGLNTLGYIAKMTADGMPIWAKPYFIHNGTAQSPAFPVNISTTSTNSIVLSSHFRNMLVFGTDTLYESNGEMFIALLDSEGGIQWAKNFGDTNPSGFNIVEASENYIDNDDNIYLTGTFHDTAYFQTDTLLWYDGEIFIVKFDKHGNEKWVKQCGKAGGWQRGYDITTDSINNVYITGVISTGQSQFGSTIIETANNRRNTYITKLDSLGNFEWAITGGAITDHPGGGQIISSTYGTSITTDGSNNVYFTGFFADTVQFGNEFFFPNCDNEYCGNFFLASYDVAGNFNWFVQSSIATPYSAGSDIEVDNEGNIYISGLFKVEIGFNDIDTISSGINPSSRDLFIAKFNPLGECMGLINSDTRSTRAKLTLSCLNQSIHIGSNYIGPSGNLEALGVEESQNQNIFVGAIENSFECELISSNHEINTSNFLVYPNPFKDYLQIDIIHGAPSFDQFLNIHIYNSMGQLVQTTFLDNGTKELNCAHLESGIYYLQIFDLNGKKMGQTARVIKIE